MSVAERLRQRMAERNISENELSRKTRVPQPTINRILSGLSSSPRKLTLEKLASGLGVSPDWLLFGVGGGEDNESSPPTTRDYALIPEYKFNLEKHVEIGCGSAGVAIKREWLEKMNANPANLFVWYARGNSMEPYIAENDIVIFDVSSVTPADRQVYAIQLPDGGITLKRLVRQLSGSWLIRSDNPDKMSFPDEVVSEAALQEIPIIGRVIWRGGSLA